MALPTLPDSSQGSALGPSVGDDIAPTPEAMKHQRALGRPEVRRHESKSRVRRRDLLRWTGGGLLALTGGGLVLLGGGSQSHSSVARSRFVAEREVMGTRASLIVAHDNPRMAKRAMTQAFEAIAAVERDMSRFLPDSDVGRLNISPGQWQAVAPDTARVLERSLAFARATDGHFDPCLGVPGGLWGFFDHRTPEVLPKVAHLKALTGGVAYRALETESRSDTAGPTRFRLIRPDVGIDLGGIAKGFAVDRAAEALLAAGIDQAVVNVGDDLRVLGGAPEGGPWRIGVRHPRTPGALLTMLELRDTAVATSGDYANAFLRDGKRYAHLLHPLTGQPARAHRSMTVQARTAMDADALATAAFVASSVDLPGLLRRLGARAWLGVNAQGEMVQS